MKLASGKVVVWMGVLQKYGQGKWNEPHYLLLVILQ